MTGSSGSKRPSNRRKSPLPLIEQGIDIGVRLAQTDTLPTVSQLKRRYGVSLATAYRRRAQIEHYLRRRTSHGRRAKSP